MKVLYGRQLCLLIPVDLVFDDSVVGFPNEDILALSSNTYILRETGGLEVTHWYCGI